MTGHEDYEGTESVTLTNPYSSNYDMFDDTVKLLKELAGVLNKLKRDDCSRMYASVRNKPKIMPILVNKQYNYNIRNNLTCRRVIKQGINFKN